MPSPTADQRVFTDRANSVHVEDDLRFHVSDAEAFADYASLLDSVKAFVTTVTSQSSLSIGNRSDEYLGTDSGGNSIVAVAFQEGKFLGVLLVAVGTGEVDTAYAEAFAAAQDQKIRKG